MNVITYRITLIEPLLATRLEGDPNSAVSYPFIPGSQLRGAVVAAYLRSRKWTPLDAGDEEAQRMFFDGRTRYLNAYPLTRMGARMLPTPLSWHTFKGTENPVFDFALAIPHEVDSETTQFQSVCDDGDHPFCWIDGDQVSFQDQAHQVNIHTTRDRRKGRATERVGAVFQYDALAAGEQFGGVILTEAQEDADLLSTLLGSVSVLGGSCNSGYGRVRVEANDLFEVTQCGWREVPGDPAEIPAQRPFLVTLLSDVIVRDPDTGQCTVSLHPTLEHLLKVKLTVPPIPEDLEEDWSDVWRIQEVGGFNRTWGLPLPQAQALDAGSVFLFTADRPISATIIRDLEWRGVGERRAEGFGRLAFGWQVERELELAGPARKPSGEKAPELTGMAQKLGQQMVERLLRHDLDRALRKRVNDLDINCPPSNAQLARFRVIAREALATGDLNRLLDLLSEIEKRRSARDQFERARIEGRRLNQWLRIHLQNPDAVWKQLGVEGAARRLGSNVSRTVSNDPMLACEYTIRLIDSVLARASRERREKEGPER